MARLIVYYLVNYKPKVEKPQFAWDAERPKTTKRAPDETAARFD
jgi:hypothetical protein